MKEWDWADVACAVVLGVFGAALLFYGLSLDLEDLRHACEALGS